MELNLPAHQTEIDYNIRIEDDFMPKEWCEEVFSIMTHVPDQIARFPWYFSEVLYSFRDSVVHGSRSLMNVHFTHNFYSEGNSCSDYGHLIQPIVDKINPDVLYRAKANLTTYDEQTYKHGYHTDEDLPGFTSIFYLNTCEGSTSFKVGEELTEVDAVQGRMVTFDNRIMHSGSTTSDTNSRVVMVLNYYKHEYALQLGPEPVRITIPQ